MSWKDHVTSVPCPRCNGVGKTVTMMIYNQLAELPTVYEKMDICWKCRGKGQIGALVEGSNKVLIYPQTEKWYAWYWWNRKTNLPIIKEMNVAANLKLPYPVDSEWPPEPNNISKHMKKRGRQRNANKNDTNVSSQSG